MADTADAGNATPNNTDSRQQPPPRRTVWMHMMANKVEALLWMTRLSTVIFTFLFLLPLFGGDSYSFYQRALIGSAATSALRLHQRLPNFQLSRQFLTQFFLEDSCHYLVYAIIFLMSYPITIALSPVFLFALLHACAYTKVVLNLMGPTALQILRNLIAKLEAQQSNVMRFIACNEIFLMPTIIFMMFTGRASLFLPFIYYRFLGLRYASRRNPFCRTLFYELRISTEMLCNKPQCPAIVRNICFKAIAFLSHLAPGTAAAAS